MDIPATIAQKLAGRAGTPETIGLSGAGVLVFDDCVLKSAPDDPFSRREVQMMTWLQGRLPVPEVLHSCVEKDRVWLLMSRLPGRMACDPHWLTRPAALLPLLADSLRLLWSVDIRNCPGTFGLEARLLHAEQQVCAGRCAPDLPLLAANGFDDPAGLLRWLKDNRPPVDPVLTHGDLSLPNLFLQDDRPAGFVDLGLCASADRYQDLAICWRSLRDNTRGCYGNYPDFPPPDSLFSALGLQPDRQKLRYYLLLEELL